MKKPSNKEIKKEIYNHYIDPPKPKKQPLGECKHGLVSMVFCDICWEEHERQKNENV